MGLHTYIEHTRVTTTNIHENRKAEPMRKKEGEETTLSRIRYVRRDDTSRKRVLLLYRPVTSI